MDIATGIGLIGGIATIVVLILIDGGNFAGYFDVHAVIVIFGGATAATMVRFPFSVILHGLPMGVKFAFSLRSSDPRGLIEEITQIAEVVRKNGPMALENVQVADTFLAQGIRYVADGYDSEFIKETMERDRDIFLQRIEEGSKVYRAYGDCAPAWGMIGTIIGMVTMFANMSDPSTLGRPWRRRSSPPSTARSSPTPSACPSPTSCTSRSGRRRCRGPSSSTASC